jgi:hypothetical protein
MTFHHYCNEPFRCWTCYIEFMRWAQARTNSPPRTRAGRPRGPNFYAHVNVISPPVQVAVEERW